MKSSISLRALTALTSMVWLLAACSTTPPSTFYTLDVQNRNAALDPETSVCGNAVVSIGPVVLPDVLLRPQIVTRENPNRLHFDEFHRWAGNLDADVAGVLIRNLAILLGTDQVVPFIDSDRHPVSFRVEVNIEQFDGQRGGTVALAGSWTLLDMRTDHRATMQRMQITQPVADASYDSLVAAHSAAVATLAQQIAVAMAQVCRTSRAVAFNQL